jgi:hypothetical protein
MAISKQVGGRTDQAISVTGDQAAKSGFIAGSTSTNPLSFLSGSFSTNCISHLRLNQTSSNLATYMVHDGETQPQRSNEGIYS